MAARSVINFYGVKKEWGEFSNFFPCASLEIRGKSWPTTEHFFQAMKFENTPHEEAIRAAPTPGTAAKWGRSRARPLRADWEDVKDAIMLEAVMAKFSQDPALREILLSTGEATLVEHTTNDRYWGDGGDGSGRNMLGITLMRVREALAGGAAAGEGGDAEGGGEAKAADDEGKGADDDDVVEVVEPQGQAAKRPRPNGVVEIVEGDLLGCEDTFVVHQCNCRTATGRGLAKDLFRAFPHADVYGGAARAASAPVRRPGNIFVVGGPGTGERGVVNLFAQDWGGKALPFPPAAKPKARDTAQDREAWFRTCLSLLSAHLSGLPAPLSVAFPHGIGCGLAGGRPAAYERMLEEFAQEVAPFGVTVRVYRLQTSAQARSSSPGR
mmetsp:Transcript_229/g.766  ORF Transcript_229/g.766 Transcript_229/m.766 type:complete len:382 (-) Transcript_229:116-1261(-)